MTLARIEDKGDHLIVVNGNAAKRGALTPEYYAALIEATETARDPRIAAVILTAEGGFFCAGGDLTQLQTRKALPVPERAARIEGLHDVMRALRACPAPVIAAVEGGAAGAGLSLALACDFIIAGESAKFTASYVKAGLTPDGGLTAALARSLPRQLVNEMCLLARPMTAETLHRHGLVTAVSPDGGTLVDAQTLAGQLFKGPGGTMAEIKRLIVAAYEQDTAAQFNAERDTMSVIYDTPDPAEGIAAFLEKRSPKFR